MCKCLYSICFTYTHFNAMNLLIFNATLWLMMTLGCFADISILIRFNFKKYKHAIQLGHIKKITVYFSASAKLRMNKINHLQWLFGYYFYHNIKQSWDASFFFFFAITSFVHMQSLYFSKKEIFQSIVKLAIVVILEKISKKRKSI